MKVMQTNIIPKKQVLIFTEMTFSVVHVTVMGTLARTSKDK